MKEHDDSLQNIVAEKDNNSQNSRDTSEAIRKIAENKPEAILQMMSMEMGTLGNPLHNKMTPEHITIVLGLAVQHDERQFNLHKISQENEHSEGISKRRYWFASFVIIIVLAIFILFLFQNKPEILVPALTGIFGLISGFLGGWGIGKKQSK